MSLPEPAGKTSKVHTIHLVAVCGTAMGALACMLQEMGYDVTGSDQNVYPPMSDFLRAKGIRIFEGFDAAHLAGRPDLVIVGNAVSKENPEVKAMQDLQLPYCSMPQAINQFAAAGKHQIVVTGTHGKTTTSSFIAWLLFCAQLDPSFLIGGLVADFGSNYRVGQGDWMVLEGDEYDTAFFDKKSKFLHYTPQIAILTSIEFDHADIFADLEQVKQAFRSFLERLQPACDLIAWDQDPRIRELLPYARSRRIFYGNGSDSEWRLGQFHFEAPFAYFEVFRAGRLFARYKTPMIGEHNLYNLLAGIAVGERLAIDRATIGRALETFKGVRRRQEVRGIKNDIIVIDDFAHHPTAVKVTVSAVRSFYKGRRLIAVFEPRTNSSRRNIFQSVYAESFLGADLVCIRQAPLLEKIPEAERFSSSRLVCDLQRRGMNARFFPDTDALLFFLCKEATPGDVVLIMSNGGFDNIHARLLNRL